MNTTTTTPQVPVIPDDITSLVDLIDSRLIPRGRYEGFEPGSGAYHIGDELGYVTEREFHEAFGDQPDWAQDAYMAARNGVDPLDVLNAYSRDPAGFDDWFSDMFYEAGHDEPVFYTEADDDGTC